MAKQKYYVVWKGRTRGIFNTWEACAAQVNGFPEAAFKSYESLAAAQAAFQQPYREALKPAPSAMALPQIPLWETAATRPLLPSICVDAACAGVPGPVEWRGVETESRKEIFRFGPYTHGTNNIGEFLAIVEGLRWIKAQGHPWPIYSDSHNALLWLKAKKCRTNLARSPKNEPLFRLVDAAEDWLKQNPFNTPLHKWDTDQWGENPADFGRK